MVKLKFLMRSRSYCTGTEQLQVAVKPMSGAMRFMLVHAIWLAHGWNVATDR